MAFLGTLGKSVERLGRSDAVKKAAVPLLNAIPLYLFFPLYPGLSVPTLLFVFGSVLTWPAVTPSKRRSRRVSITLLIAGLVWSVSALYLLPGGALYFFKADSHDPTQSRVVPLGGSTVTGHLVYLTDPVRASRPVRMVMAAQGFAPEFLDRLQQVGPASIVMPLSSALRYRVLGSGTPVYAEELSTSYTGTQLAIEIFPAGKDGAAQPYCGVALAASSFPLVHYARNVSNSPELPWNVVLYPKEAEEQAAVYAAELDLAIQAASGGDFESAIGTLESAFKDVPTDLERARLYAVLGFVSSAVIGGSIGVTQGLAFFNQAMQHWPRAASRTRISRAQMDSPVDRWLFDCLKTVFSGREEDYPVWSRILGNSEPHVETWGIYGTDEAKQLWWFNQIPDTPVESLLAAERQRLLNIVTQSATKPEEMAKRLETFVGGRPDVARWAFDVLLVGAYGPTVMGKGLGLGIPMSVASPWSEASEDAASLCIEPWRPETATCFPS